MLEAFAAALAPLGEPPALASDGHFAAEAEHNEHNEHNEYDEYDNVESAALPRRALPISLGVGSHPRPPVAHAIAREPGRSGGGGVLYSRQH